MTTTEKKKYSVFGQDLDIILAVIGNIVSWFITKFFPNYLRYLLPKIKEEDTSSSEKTSPDQTRCIAIGRPGGKEQLRIITLKSGYVTRGYNVVCGSDDENNEINGCSPFVNISNDTNIPNGMVLVRVHSFSINYADCCIRWGLYESANTFVGWPIVPGFDISGTIERVYSSSNSNFRVGDKVYGATFFGGYSTRVLVPEKQLRKLPRNLTLSEAAAIPAVSLTALYILHLGGQFNPPTEQKGCSTLSISGEESKTNDVPKPILIHSCAGGVGSMLVQMSKLVGLSPIVGVVGRTTKVDAAISLGCDVVIDKSSTQDWWKVAKEASCVVSNRDGKIICDGFKIVADPNGVSTLQKSYEHLGATGRLVVFGFHSNLPMGEDMLHPLNWIRMILKMMKMPTFDVMDLVSSNKSILGFNLSFFVDQIDVLTKFYDQIEMWLESDSLQCPRIVEMDGGMEDVSTAHELIQSGKSIGKIVVSNLSNA